MTATATRPTKPLPQPDLFGAHAADRDQPEDIVPGIRARCLAMLAEARAAPAGSWGPKHAEGQAGFFHLTSHYLPLDERLALRAEYHAALAQLAADPVRPG